MRLRSLLIALLLALVVAFAAANWSAILAPTSLNLLVTTWEAPLGLVMLGLLAVVVLAFGLYMVLWQGTILVETRRQSKELQAQRTLADQAEASRFTELRGVMLEELRLLGERVDRAETALRTEIRETSNSVAASLAEMDDRLRPALPR